LKSFEIGLGARVGLILFGSCRDLDSFLKSLDEFANSGGETIGRGALVSTPQLLIPSTGHLSIIICPRDVLMLILMCSTTLPFLLRIGWGVRYVCLFQRVYIHFIPLVF
jgi:hypothetical protein